MRILIVHNYYQHPGGEDTVVQQEVDALKDGNTVELLTFKNKKGIKGLMQFALYPWNFLAANKILKKAKNFQADVVHIHNTHYAIGPLVFRKLHAAGFKTIQTLHNHRLLDPSATLFVQDTIFMDTIDKPFPWKSIRLKTLDNSFLKTFWTAFTYYIHHKLGTWQKVDKYLVFTDFMKGLVLKSSKNIDVKQIEIKTNAIQAESQTHLERTPKFVFIGRLSIEKGIIPLLQAFQLKNTHTLEIYGNGPLSEAVIEASKKSKNIIYKGFQPKLVLNEALATSQALIVPSLCFEGMPMTILEAFANGTPVLTSDIGALKEMITDNYNGFHFEAGNIANIAETLDRFNNLSSEDKQRISNNCFKEYESKYRLIDNIKSLSLIYKDLIN